MSQTYTAVIKQAGAWWIGWIVEVPGVNCQEPTREELLETLGVTVAGRSNSIGAMRVRRPVRDSRRSRSRYEREALLRHLRKHGCVMLREGRPALVVAQS